jgi:hypothetical protein
LRRRKNFRRTSNRQRNGCGRQQVKVEEEIRGT